MSNYKAKYYSWRRKRIRERARNRRKIATHKYAFLQLHMTPKEQKQYESFGFKWYRASKFTFGTDITGLNLSKQDLDLISDLPEEKRRRENPKPPVSVKHNPVVVTFDKVYRDDGSIHEYALFNGEIEHPTIHGANNPNLSGWLERNGKPNV